MVKVLAVGASIFTESLKRQGVEVIEVDWSPPPELEKDLEDILSRML